jgi:hypothetical protein
MSYRRPLLLSGFGLVCFAFLGCMTLPFCIPEVNTIPPVDLGTTKNDVHIFRVDVTEQMTVDPAPGDVLSGPHAVETYELTQVPADAPGVTPRQVGLTFRQGWRKVGLGNFNTDCLSHTIALRLYRPGFDTIEVQCSRVPREVHWTEAVDLSAQEKALDDVLGVSLFDAKVPLSKAFWVTRKLEPGTTSDAQRDALLFCAGECERLARRATRDSEDPDMRGRLLAKAARLKALAEGKYEENEQ